ncbi:MAG: MarR family transcriptional regulator [bacterium]
MTTPAQGPTALDWSTDNCTIARALSVLGEKWTFHVLREVFQGIRRFDDTNMHPRGRPGMAVPCTTASAEAVSAADSTPLEFAVMAFVSPSEGESDLHQTALAARLGVDRNTTSLLVGSLELKGLITRRVSDTDRRARLVRLTPRGEQLFAQLHPKGMELQWQVLDVLAPAERDLLLDLLVRVIEVNPGLARPGAGRRKRGANGATG